ncbi:putative short-chain type dehydrogenase/reductase [Mycolicibacterium hassiacum DSM 44199]|uniref:Putative short-chain type dehydrogenase/reductase n=1 Tax=Mycolicibacterium hassiacum (strain DSM 44199 / CIP 105218 / JCM 12690 / 3849) TaxID=1122247 RepID=K5B781_MYCHD|nr:hypothetical protein [Mycolicibacterium hassiacum]EKF21488.1 putative short-chain type dehydrogenase/reductase [Mycolicibacterium hassiacum DSM 44199]MDA4087100.1 hypothetical protein [Mycolicibacterium hassiacum DSM 44199]VCT89331.1 hypothetical protein MHAS_01021 [Mycolicibacterium hassiacum DSM 44199]
MSELRFDDRVAVTTGAAEIADTAVEAFGRLGVVVDNVGIRDPNAGMPPELCSPAVVLLAHESCPLNRKVLLTGMGGVPRPAVVRAQGSTEVSLTAEDIADNLGQILSVDDACVTE